MNSTHLSLPKFQHLHDFNAANLAAEQKTLAVIWLTVITMIAEIIAGSWFGSMALLADGWHMGTHVFAFVVSLFAYRYARFHSRNQQFSFGTGKVTALGGFTSGLLLLSVVFFIVIEAFQRFIYPVEIQYGEALTVAIIGLLVNVGCLFLMEGTDHHHHHGHDHAHHHDDHDHDDHHHAEAHDHDHDHDDDHEHHHSHASTDHNFKAAYLHILADALTSLLAIAALILAYTFGWTMLDPLIALVGAMVIFQWSRGLLRETSNFLLDRQEYPNLEKAVRAQIESDSDNQITDLHLWQIAPEQFAVIISLVTHAPQAPDYYKKLLASLPTLVHITVEINPCDAQCHYQKAT